ncbi:MAG: peptidoglycan synthetase [Crocinitomicaceae bacterium]|nr:peptidoglycan synthetase [Crocinitomicaceae bacterium]
MRIHFIAIGGSAMHNLALALADAGHQVSGSDDQILEPSRSRLREAGLLPRSEGWHPEQINENLDCVILGMHARQDNPELLQAQRVGVKIQSYPEFLFSAVEKDRRIVVGGSHGKTTITSMLLHAFKAIKSPVNFMVGAQLEGFDRMVHLDPRVQTAVFEGDEYLSSPIDRRPKFFWYQAHFTLLTGIAWDHINVFPTEEDYIKQFDTYLETLAPNASVVWCEEDPHLAAVIRRTKRSDLTFIPYNTPVSALETDGTSMVSWADGKTSRTPLIGTHNMQNLAGARALAATVGISASDFDSAMINFTGAARRLELLLETQNFIAFRDFAHAPSKLRATTAGVKDAFPNRHLTAVFELHTFSSLNRAFLPTYRKALERADEQIVYYDPEVLKQKKLPELDSAFIAECFGNSNRLRIIDSKADLQVFLDAQQKADSVLLMMSSGWFSKVTPSWLD